MTGEKLPDDQNRLDLIPSGIDPYDFAFDVADIRIEQWKAYGVIRRVNKLTRWEEADDHFDDLTREYKWVCRHFGLPWPPPVRDEGIERV